MHYVCNSQILLFVYFCIFFRPVAPRLHRFRPQSVEIAVAADAVETAVAADAVETVVAADAMYGPCRPAASSSSSSTSIARAASERELVFAARATQRAKDMERCARDTAGDGDAGEMRSPDIAGSPEIAGDADATKQKRSVCLPLNLEPAGGLLLKPIVGKSWDQFIDPEHDEDHAEEHNFDIASCPSDQCSSVGDSTADDIAQGNFTAVAARRHENAQPKIRVVGDKHVYNTPAPRNSMPEVGNIAMMVGNWGQRSADGGGYTRLNREAHDRQVMGSPAQIMILLEASDAVKAMLEHEPEFVFDRPQSRPPGRAAYGNVKTRDWYEHYVVIGKEQDKQILMAGRKNNCTGIECHTYEPWFDGPFTTKTQREGRHHQNHDMHVLYEAKRRVFGYRDSRDGGARPLYDNEQ